MSGNNVVPMAPVGRGAPAPMTGTWPPQGGWGGFPAGCCPPGGMDALLQCYCDIQAATAFISKIVTDLAANDPAFQQALVDAIAASGSNLPLTGVTNGADAQPGQVGEFVQMMSPTINFPTGANVQSVTMGILQPGDWTIWIYTETLSNVHDINIAIAPLPPGFNYGLETFNGAAGGEIVTLTSPAGRALISVPSLVAIQLGTNIAGPGPAAGTVVLGFAARRAR